MSTATTAFVRSVIAASTAAGSRFSVRGSTSAKTGVAPSKMKQLAEATNETGEVIASSPGPRPAMWQSRCSPRPPPRTARPRARRPAPRSGRSSGPAKGARSGAPRARAPPPARPSTAEQGVSPVCRCSSLGRGALGVLEPLRPALAAASNGVDVRRLELERDRADAELDVVDLPQRSHLSGGAAHEGLVGEVEIRADQALLDDAVADVLRDLDHRVARDPGQDRGGEVGRVDHAVLDDEDVLA